MKQPKYQNYRVCYPYPGTQIKGKEIYELYKYCKCTECKQRRLMNRTPANCAIAYTKDLSRVDEVADFLNSWTCDDGRKQLDYVYFHFDKDGDKE